jgi:hypothetical protein
MFPTDPKTGCIPTFVLCSSTLNHHHISTRPFISSLNRNRHCRVIGVRVQTDKAPSALIDIKKEEKRNYSSIAQVVAVVVSM